MNACDLFYAIDLPEVFMLEHPLASVMGRAQYGNNFFFYQGCTVGGNTGINGNTYYPHIDDNVLMLSNSSIIGKSIIGKNVILASGCTIINECIPNNSLVFGKSPSLMIKIKSEKEMLSRLHNFTFIKYDGYK